MTAHTMISLDTWKQTAYDPVSCEPLEYMSCWTGACLLFQMALFDIYLCDICMSPTDQALF